MLEIILSYFLIGQTFIEDNTISSIVIASNIILLAYMKFSVSKKINYIYKVLRIK